jgi:hypothetical protein
MVRLPFEINKERIAQLFKVIHNMPGFIVDFDDVWPILNWSNRDNAKRKLKDPASKLQGLFKEGNFPNIIPVDDIEMMFHTYLNNHHAKTLLLRN